MPKKLKQLYNEIYKQFNPSTTPMIIMNFLVDSNEYDINVTPDKREIFLKNEN